MGIGQPRGRARGLRGRRRPTSRCATRRSTSTPRRPATPSAWRKLAALGDDSSNYLWKLHAARDIMRAVPHRPGRARAPRPRCSSRRTPPRRCCTRASSTAAFAGPAGAIAAAYDDGELVGAAARHAGDRPAHRPRAWARRRSASAQPRFLYRGLRPEALALALYIGAQVRAGVGRPGAPSLTITSTVRDQRYQRELVQRNREATRDYSLHTTGWAFDVLRRYRSERQARRLPGRPRPAAVAEPDRLRLRAGRHPRHRLRATRRPSGRCSIGSR